MNNTKLWINVLLDESGSMVGVAEETIKNFNGFIAEQREISDALVLATLTTFSTSPRHLYIARPVQEVPKLSRANYDPDGGTALFDAIAASIITVDQSMRREDEKTGVLFLINTDGEENSSVKYSRAGGGLKAIRKMVQQRQDDGWNFVFMGADISGWGGSELGIVQAMGAKKAKSAQMYRAVGKGARLMAAAVNRGEQVEDFFGLNAADYEGLND